MMDNGEIGYNSAISAQGVGYSDASFDLQKLNQWQSQVQTQLAANIGRWAGDASTYTVRRMDEYMADIPIPGWVKPDNGYIPKRAASVSCHPHNNYFISTLTNGAWDEISGKIQVVAVHYSPDKDTLGEDYIRVFIVEDKTGVPFPKMDGVWKKASAAAPAVMEPEARLTPDGRLVGFAGNLTQYDIYRFASEIVNIYYKWRAFPKEDDFDRVEELARALDDIRRFKSENEHGAIHRRIDELREDIKNAQKSISELEKDLNEVCEKAAEGMNLIEESGYDPEQVEKDSRTKYDEAVRIDGTDFCVSPSTGVISRATARNQICAISSDGCYATAASGY